MSTTITDLFCGAGGSSTGAVQVPGVTVRAASNHWQLAVDTHNTNHPDADHICADLSQINPRYFPKTDILWASPECTNHSIAKGKARANSAPDLFGDTIPAEAAERSRATMWDVPRFAEVHRYQSVIVENVVDAANWTPFKAWLLAMDSLGYDSRVVYLNSMHAWTGGAAAPQSRDRMYVVFWRKGNRRPDLDSMQRPPAWCPEHGEVRAMQSWKNPDRRWGRYRSQYVYRCPNVSCRNRVVEPNWIPAASIIDWTDRGTRIGDRPRPLAEKTMSRIRAGINRYWKDSAEPLVANNVSGSDSTRSSSVNEPTPTMVAGGLHASLLTPSGEKFAPFIAELRGGGSDARSTRHALSTVTASGTHHALIMRNNTGGAEMSTPVHEPVRTVTTHGHQSLITEGRTIDPEDCHFRMLSPKEIKEAMAFPAEYQLLGNKREQVRMSGNAVTPPAARDLIATVAESLAN